MERKMVKYTTMIVCVFSMFSCALVWMLPYLEIGAQRVYEWVMHDQIEREQRYALLEQMSGLEIMDYNTEQARQEAEGNGNGEDISFSQEMRLELPKGTGGEQVTVWADYINHRIEIKLPGADKNYLYDYSIMGKSDAIADLSYFGGADGGTMILTMSKVMEAESSYDENYLYLDFLSPKEIYDHVVVVDAGHGGDQPGAISGQYYEKDITLAIVKEIQALFEEASDQTIGVYYTRLDDSAPSLMARADLANLSDADLFVSVHINSLKGHDQVQGTGVMYDELAADTAFDTREFAQNCLDEEIAALGSQSKGLIEGNKIYIIRSAQMPVALVEVGFMNNSAELAKLLTPDYQKKAAQGIYNAIIKSLDQIEQTSK